MNELKKNNNNRNKIKKNIINVTNNNFKTCVLINFF